MTEREPETTDSDAMNAFVNGDAEALGLLVQRHRKSLYGYLFAMTGNAAEADDVFQETWMRIIRHAHRYRNLHFRGWMMRIAHNVLIDRQRRCRATSSLDAAADGQRAWVDDLPDTHPLPFSNLESAELGQAILQSVGKLPADQREVFLMRTQTPLSFEEIAKIQGVSRNTALGRMHYAVKRLRAELSQSRAGYSDTEHKRQDTP